MGVLLYHISLKTFKAHFSLIRLHTFSITDYSVIKYTLRVQISTYGCILLICIVALISVHIYFIYKTIKMWTSTWNETKPSYMKLIQADTQYRQLRGIHHISRLSTPSLSYKVNGIYSRLNQNRFVQIRGTLMWPKWP